MLCYSQLFSRRNTITARGLLHKRLWSRVQCTNPQCSLLLRRLYCWRISQRCTNWVLQLGRSHNLVLQLSPTTWSYNLVHSGASARSYCVPMSAVFNGANQHSGWMHTLSHTTSSPPHPTPPLLYVFTQQGDTLLPALLHFPDAPFVECLNLEAFLQFSHQVLAIRKMTSMKCTLHDWNRKKSHGAKSNEYGIWYVGNDFMPALLEKDNRAMSPGFVDKASYITDPVSYTFLFYTSPHFTCTRWIC